MAMLDAFFNKAAFKGAKCKTLLKLTIPRIKLLRNRRELQLKQMRRDIAKLLENGQEATARIRVEHIIREENMMAAQEIIELFCELIAVRLPIIETQRECPLDLKEAISSICFAAPRCSDLPELQQVQMLFAAKYGREFVAAATELMPDCGVNRQIIELLSIRAPTVEAKLKLLKEIAEEHELDWDPTASESEFLKPHEDLLNGPNNFISGSTVPLPKEKHEPSMPCASPVEESHDEHSSDAGLDTLDLPEVPSVPIRTISDITPSAPEFVPLQPPPTHDPSHDHVKPSPSDEDLLHSAEGPTASIYHPPTHSVAVKENKQFIPFVSSPVPPSSFVEDRSAATSVSTPSAQVNIREQRESLSHTKSEINTDLQDVLVAAQAAADTAERAAAAARAAASLAQVRIAELVSKRNNGICESIGNNDESSNQLELSEKPNFDQHQPSGHMDHVPSYGSAWRSDSKDESPKPQIAHQFQRSASLEDDSYFSYPNLFTSQDKNLKPGSQPSAGNSHSAHNF